MAGSGQFHFLVSVDLSNGLGMGQRPEREMLLCLREPGCSLLPVYPERRVLGSLQVAITQPSLHLINSFLEP